MWFSLCYGTVWWPRGSCYDPSALNVGCSSLTSFLNRIATKLCFPLKRKPEQPAKYILSSTSKCVTLSYGSMKIWPWSQHTSLWLWCPCHKHHGDDEMWINECGVLMSSWANSLNSPHKGDKHNAQPFPRVTSCVQRLSGVSCRCPTETPHRKRALTHSVTQTHTHNDAQIYQPRPACSQRVAPAWGFRPITILGTDYKYLYTGLATLQNGTLDLHFYLNQSAEQVKSFS